nr:hypothetical protein [Bradyrhizobium sp. UFLA03-84]
MRLAYSYWSKVSGLPDIPQCYATITMALATDGGETILTVTQQVPPSPIRREACCLLLAHDAAASEAGRRARPCRAIAASRRASAETTA